MGDKIPERKETTDVDLAGYLLLKGFKLIQPLTIRGKYILFTFDNSPELEAECVNFYNNNTDVDAYSLCESIRKLRSMLRTTKASGGAWK